ncbi:MAG: macro domain-containing protein [Planctomycetota bacterium]
MNPLELWRQRNLKVWKAARRAVGLQVTLVDRAPGLAEAWARAFADCESVAVLEGDLLALSGDALVSPANSFGDMSGGIDQAIDQHYGGEAQRRVRQAIEREFWGELPVGAALLTRYETRRFPYLITAPTMRVPGEVRGSINAFLAHPRPPMDAPAHPPSLPA